MKMGINIGDLTEREKDVLEYIVKGFGDKEIARNLFISVNTVRTHVERIFMKLGVSDRKELIVKMLREK
jgi:DNA-binding NarL/FixJ family response regulator